MSASSTSNEPTFTAIVPNFNDGARIGGALAALGGQTVPFDEILVVDDGSTDDSVAIIERLLGAMPRARLVRHAHNLGVVAALNTGLREARGGHVFMASANDTYSTRVVEWARELLLCHPDTVFLCGNAMMNVAGGRARTVEVSLPQTRGRVSAEAVLAAGRRRPLVFSGGATFVALAALREAGGLCPALRWSSDWFLYHLFALRHGCCVIPEQLATLESTEDSYSSGMLRWPEQGEVTSAFLELLRDRHPSEWPRFRAAAVLPTYGLRELRLILGRRDLRAYVTPLLAWRCLDHTRALWPAVYPIRRLLRSVGR